ncbi:MAG: hypothetical protein AAF349_20600, partial [Cyanobacteria bacterium P01_A01_bin.68]
MLLTSDVQLIQILPNIFENNPQQIANFHTVPHDFAQLNGKSINLGRRGLLLDGGDGETGSGGEGPPVAPFLAQTERDPHHETLEVWRRQFDV